MFRKSAEHIYAPATGTTMNLQNVDDEVFANGMMGPGLVINIAPSELCIYAPAAGTVDALYPTGHALGLKTKTGTALLLHVGLESFKKKGLIKKYISKGDMVRKGQLLLEIDPSIADPTDLIILLTFPELSKTLTPLYEEGESVQSRKQRIFRVDP